MTTEILMGALTALATALTAAGGRIYLREALAPHTDKEQDR